MYQYSQAMLHALAGLRDEGYETVLLTRPGSHVDAPPDGPWRFDPLFPPSFRSSARSIVLSLLPTVVADVVRRFRRSIARTSYASSIATDPQLERWFRGLGIDLLLFPGPDPLAVRCGVPSIMAVHDVQHRLQPQWPEVSSKGEAEVREQIYRAAARSGVMLLVDSEVGREDILNLYTDDGLDPRTVAVLPFVIPPYITQLAERADPLTKRSQLAVPDRFIFYPAQFWPHKNHRNLIEALALLKTRDRLEIPLVLVGGRTGPFQKRTFQEATSLARDLGVSGQISYLGYVRDEDMPALYRRAVALVMPTFFGPTNIPILEAWSLNCPVLTSDIRGVREQAGDAALLVDPASVDDIAGGIRRLWTDDAIRMRLAARGREYLSRYTPEDFRRRLGEVLSEAERRLSDSRSGSGGA